MNIEELKKPLDRKVVKERQQGGGKVSYIEGWHAINEANRIFGYDKWNRETVMCECVWSGERDTRSGKKPAASYIARVRITVITDDGDCVIREGTGAGSGFGADAGEAHESAIKEAETDAMKRALMTFGNPFGLALYDKEQRAVQNTPPPPEKTPVERIVAALASSGDIFKILDHAKFTAEFDAMSPQDKVTVLKVAVENAAHPEELSKLWGHPAFEKGSKLPEQLWGQIQTAFTAKEQLLLAEAA